MLLFYLLYIYIYINLCIYGRNADFPSPPLHISFSFDSLCNSFSHLFKSSSTSSCVTSANPNLTPNFANQFQDSFPKQSGSPSHALTQRNNLPTSCSAHALPFFFFFVNIKRQFSTNPLSSESLILIISN